MINNDQSRESVLFIILERDNLDRMKKADPITLSTEGLKGILPSPKYPDRMGVMVAYEEDEVAVYQLAQSGDTHAMFQYVMRGYKWKRDLDGDHNAFKIPRNENPQTPSGS